jgi:lipopolysaccharide export system permease protein
LGQNKTTPDLINFIEREKEKGNSNINAYLNELHQRTAMPVSIIILTFLALSLSSQKKRGGLGNEFSHRDFIGIRFCILI